MNLKVGFMFLVYYAAISLIFLLSGSPIAAQPGYSTNIYLNDSSLASSEIDQGGLFGTGVSFSRFFLFATFGLGLPDDTPATFKTVFFLWQTIITILAVMFIIASIWNG